MEKIEFINDENQKEEFYVLLDTVVNERVYILASDVDPEGDEEGECFILREIKQEEDNVIYESVESDEEYTSISKIFEELLEDEGVSLEKNGG